MAEENSSDMPTVHELDQWENIADWHQLIGYVPPFDGVLLARYAKTPDWWRRKRYPFVTPWWRTSEVPPPVLPEQIASADERDFCFEQTGFSEITLGRRILLRSKRQSTEGLCEATPDVQGEIARTTKIGLVLSVGVHAFPPSDVYGLIPFCQVGDWVVFSNWERSESLEDTLFYCNDLHITSIIAPSSWATVLYGYE